MARGMSRGVRVALGIGAGTPWWLRKPKKARHARHAAHASHQMKAWAPKQKLVRGPHGKGY